MLYGLLNAGIWTDILATFILTQITIATVTIYLHRHQSHRAIDLHPSISHFFRFWTWFTTGMITREWVGIHRKHHAGTDSPDDPHSPVQYGIRKVLLEGTELYREAAKDTAMIEKYSHGTPDDAIERHLYSKYPTLGIVLMLILNVLLFGIPGITIWAIQMLWIPFFAAGVVNGIGHYWGYRNFECPDASRNIIPFGIFICGEELHNNHHTFPTSAKLSVHWWEIDLGWVYIKTLSFLGLATIKKIPPRLATLPGKNQIDLDTVKAVISNRFQVLANYTKDVIKPVLEEEKSRLPERVAVFKRAKKLLLRERSLLTKAAKDKLSHLLEERANLKIVYDYRCRLQDVWTKKRANQQELLDALSQWCKQAEASGIEALKQFAEKVRCYVPEASLSL